MTPHAEHPPRHMSIRAGGPRYVADRSSAAPAERSRGGILDPSGPRGWTDRLTVHGGCAPPGTGAPEKCNPRERWVRPMFAVELNTTARAGGS